MTPAFFSSSRKVVATRDAVEHRVDRDLARAFDPGEHLLLLDRDAELLVDAQDFGIDLVEAAELGLAPWARRNNKRPGNRSAGMSSLAQLTSSISSQAR